MGRNEPRTHLTERLIPLTDQPVTYAHYCTEWDCLLFFPLPAEFTARIGRVEGAESDDVDLIADLLLADGSL